MHSKIIPLAIGAVVLVIVSALVYTQSGVRESASDQGKSFGSSESYSMAAVAAHKDAESCWSVIDGGVYDLTAWIGQHPGGERAILGLCGVDGSAAFHAQHGTATLQTDILTDYKIGTLDE